MPVPATICQEIASDLGALFTCEETNGYVRVRTPFLYPDGDLIDLFLKDQDDEMTVSDLGETTRWLRMQTTSPRRSKKQQAMIDDVALNHGVEIFRGMIQARVRPEFDVGEVITRVAQASLRVSDLWFTFRTRAVQSVTDEVEELLQEEDLPYDRGERFPGRSGRVWPIDFHTRAPKKSSLVRVLTTGSRSAAKGIAESVLAGWYDLSHMRTGPEAMQFVSLVDDTADLWREEDLKLVGEFSEVAFWSQPREFVATLRAA